MRKSEIKQGDVIVSCGTWSDPTNPGVPFIAPKVYRATIRKKDGALVWRLSYVDRSSAIATPNSIPTPKALKLAREYAKQHGFSFLADVKHNNRVASVQKPTRKEIRVPRIETQKSEEPLLLGRFAKIHGEDIL